MRRVVALLLFGVLAFGCAAAEPVPSPTPSYVEDLDPAFQTRMTVSDAVAIALNYIDRVAQGATAAGLPTTTARIVRVSTRRAADIQSVEISGPGGLAGGAVWIVRAEGTFTTNRPQGPQHYWGSGYFLIDDATGSLIGMGMP